MRLSTLKYQLAEGKIARVATAAALIGALAGGAAVDKDTRPEDKDGKKYAIPHQRPVVKSTGKVIINGKEHEVFFPGNIAYPSNK